MIHFDRRRLVFAGAAALLGTRSAIAQSGTTFTYRGITVDTGAAQGQPNLKEVVASLKHQIEIVVDCDAKPEIMTFFKSQPVWVRPGQGDGGGHFSSKVAGVTVDAAVVAPEKPVLLHELLHAYHFRVLPGALRNPDLERFYGIAKQNELYPPDAYVLKNVQEFFAVTGASISGAMSTDRPTIAPRCTTSSRSIINGSAISSACRRKHSPRLLQNAQRRVGRGFASLMQPSRPGPGVPFAVSAAMR